MVLLTITPAILDAVKQLRELPSESTSELNARLGAGGPSLEDAALGRPISHSQVLALWKDLKRTNGQTPSLEDLLEGCRVYVAPPKPKPEPTKEYVALMARLRREEEARSYERMVNPPPRLETFNERFPYASTQANFAAANRPTHEADMGDDDVTYNEIHRQMMLLLNFLVSIVGVAATLWVAARWWALPARLFLTMGGSALVGVAEVVVYQGYVWRMGEAKQRQAAKKEVREVVQTWVVGKDQDQDQDQGQGQDGDKNRDEQQEDEKTARESDATILLEGAREGADASGIRKRTTTTIPNG